MSWRISWLVSALGASLLSAHCSSDQPLGQLADGCQINSDCNNPLSCTFGRCHTTCNATRDCPTGQRCVVNANRIGVCLLPEEITCVHNTDCAVPLVCGVDNRCRNECVGDRDCPREEICTPNGVCADPPEVNDAGQIVGPEGGVFGAGGNGATGGATTGGSRDGSAGAAGGTAGSGGVGGAGGSGFAGASPDGASGAGGAGPVDAGRDVVVVASDPCVPLEDGGFAPEPMPNDDRSQATPISLETSVKGCLETSTDVDYYRFSAPASPSAGGYLTIEVTDISMALSEFVAEVFTAKDNTSIYSQQTYNGADNLIYVATKPSTPFLVSVRHVYTGRAPGPYTVAVRFHPVDDPAEPNHTRANAAPAAVGTAIQGFLFAGYDSSLVPLTDWPDVYKFDLTVGTYAVSLTQLPPSFRGAVRVMNSSGQVLQTITANSNPGADIVGAATIAADGTYYLEIGAEFAFPDGLTTVGDARVIPASYTRPYVFKVTRNATTRR